MIGSKKYTNCLEYRLFDEGLTNLLYKIVRTYDETSNIFLMGAILIVIK